eukprot:1139692-Pelagomonas_calceolata.AAC.7
MQTAVAEGLAQRIVSNDVPEALQGRTLMALDMGSLIADGVPYHTTLCLPLPQQEPSSARAVCNPSGLGHSQSQSQFEESESQRLSVSHHSNVPSVVPVGAKFRGEFEDRLKSVIKEVTDSAGKIILFIDEIHTVRTGQDRGGKGYVAAYKILIHAQTWPFAKVATASNKYGIMCLAYLHKQSSAATHPAATLLQLHCYRQLVHTIVLDKS